MYLQEYFIRTPKGDPVRLDDEKQRVVQCIEAAIVRRVSEVILLLHYFPPSAFCLS